MTLRLAGPLGLRLCSLGLGASGRKPQTPALSREIPVSRNSSPQRADHEANHVDGHFANFDVSLYQVRFGGYILFLGLRAWGLGFLSLAHAAPYAMS